MSAPNDAGWYIMRDGQRFGPFNADVFARFEEEGQLRPTDGIWQTGTDTWIAYSDYEARKAAARLVAPQREGSSTKPDHKRCAICRWVRSGLRALTKALTTTFQSISTTRAATHAVSAATPAAEASPAAAAPEGALSRTVPASADPIPASIRPSPLRSHQSDVRPLASDPVIEQPTADEIRHHSNQYAPWLPRLANEGQAASHIGLELATFRAWVADGRLPHALPNSDKYDLKALHMALDRMSGIVSRANGSHDWIERLASSQAEGAGPARE